VVPIGYATAKPNPNHTRGLVAKSTIVFANLFGFGPNISLRIVWSSLGVNVCGEKIDLVAASKSCLSNRLDTAN
jgi:hypothetical protein